MKDTMEADLKEITEAEEKAKADFEGMMKSSADRGIDARDRGKDRAPWEQRG
jgi:hypothetical protein